MIEQTYERGSFSSIPASIGKLLQTLITYTGLSPWERDLERLVAEIAPTDPFSIILFTELLAREHWRYKKYVKMRRVRIESELEEVINRHFWNDLNEAMAAYLKDHKDPDDAHLKRLILSYYPQGRQLLQAKYREIYPRSWRRKWRSRRYLKPRIRVDKHRRFEMPEPLCFGETLLPQQFYFMRKTKNYVRGCGSGSGTREAHSFFGLAYLKLSKRVPVPTYMFVYDKDNVLRFVDCKNDFVLDPTDMGSNCDIDYRVISDMTRLALKAKAVLRVPSRKYLHMMKPISVS